MRIITQNLDILHAGTETDGQLQYFVHTDMDFMALATSCGVRTIASTAGLSLRKNKRVLVAYLRLRL